MEGLAVVFVSLACEGRDAGRGWRFWRWPVGCRLDNEI